MRTKYNLEVEVKQGTVSLYSGTALMDVVFPNLPPAGKFTINFRHENLRGFAKMLCLLATFGAKIGVKILTKADWRACAITGKDIPESVLVEFSSKAAAVSTIYVSMIPCMVAGNWRSFPEDSDAALAAFLNHIQANGINMFLNTGAFCGGRLMPLAKKGPKVQAEVVETIIDAKKALSGKVSVKKEDTPKQSAVARPKVKGKSTRKARTPKSKAEPVTESVPEGNAD